MDTDTDMDNLQALIRLAMARRKGDESWEDTHSSPAGISASTEAWLKARINDTPELTAARKKAKVRPDRPIKEVENQQWLTNAHISIRLTVVLPFFVTYDCGGYALGTRVSACMSMS